MATPLSIEESYKRAKARYDAQKALQLKEASENLALQTKQIGQLRNTEQQSAIQSASQNYISGQQAQRVLPSQLAQGGLAQSGYRSLAQQKMSQDVTKARQGIEGNLNTAMQGYDRTQEANKLNYNQNVRSAQNTYNQNVADLNLDRKQGLENQVGTQSGVVEVPVNSNSKDTTNQVMNYNDVVLAGNSGRFTYDQYKKALESLGVDATTKNALLQSYLRYQAQRSIQ